MQKKSKRSNKVISKTKEKRYEDFYDYIFILDENLTLYENCEDLRYRQAYLKVILFALRCLLGKESGLIEEICSTHQLQVAVRIEGIKEAPETNPIHQDKEISLKEYLDENAITILRNQYSKREFIWQFASEDASHSFSFMSHDIAMGKELIISGLEANDTMVLSIARTIISVGISVAQSLKEKYSEFNKEDK